MTYQLSESDKEERDLLLQIANGSIEGEEAESILVKLFPHCSIIYAQEDCEYVLALIYKLLPGEIDLVMKAFPFPLYQFTDYQKD